MDDEEYRRLRKAENQTTAEYLAFENADKAEKEVISDAEFYDDAYFPKTEETEHQGPTYTQDDFVVLLPGGKMIRIAQDSNLSWLVMFIFCRRSLLRKGRIF